MFESVSPEININLDADWTPEELDKISETFETLSAYAKLKTRAMRYRIAGHIEDAFVIENFIDYLYARLLPEWARW